jgi:hypothetical protein
MGEWGKGASPDQRTAFAMKVRRESTQYSVMVVGPESSPWGNERFLGAMFSRSDALDHPLIAEAFHVVDHLVNEDQEIRRYLTLQ